MFTRIVLALLLVFSLSFARANDLSIIFNGINSDNGRTKADDSSLTEAVNEGLQEVQKRREQMFIEAQIRAEARSQELQNEYNNGSRPQLERAEWADQSDEYGWTMGFTCRGKYFSISYTKEISWQPESMSSHGLPACSLSKKYEETAGELASRTCGCYR